VLRNLGGLVEFTNVGESLRRHWASHNVEINAGVPESALSSFEAKYGVILPQEMRDYFLSVNGMPPDVVDTEMIRFWMLEEIEPLPQGAPDFADSNYIQNPQSLFLFADYSIWAHAYAIRLSKAAGQTNEVFIIGHDSPIQVSNSFSEFVDRYLSNKDLLFG
jgi:hypothetical protein